MKKIKLSEDAAFSHDVARMRTVLQGLIGEMETPFMKERVEKALEKIDKKVTEEVGDKWVPAEQPTSR
jgi:hypothetical protein